MKMQAWLSNLKLAIIEEDINALEDLLDSFAPQNMNTQELIEAKALIEEAFVLMQNKKAVLAVNMKKIQRAKEFLKS
ncbi:hypothetical protein DMB91_03555 [Campylobacter sp. MIT 97-5078]|nr:hypothetical protein LR59_09515 [Campylobacter sp. MIT 97-5078]KGI57423.1 hypothetical protein LR59_01560 [Campylobacter sp. MIT 97-5078]TQR27346.1 hypothetical protein DMB91_03555 [Campylobacter sp. MIT 97-5078]